MAEHTIGLPAPGAGSIHLIGIGGTGMSALARLLHGRGHRITGSDQRASEAVNRLADLGLDVWSGSRPERIAGAALVVASSAVPADDPEWARAGDLGLTRWYRPDLLTAVSTTMPTIGPTGTHGKTSTTAMMVMAARAAGLDPSFVVGSDLVELRTNGHAGSDDLLILEVDEAFGTFEAVRLGGLTVTNLEADHLDHFGSMDALEAAFARVVRSVDGPVVCCADDPGSLALAERTAVATYGTDPGATWTMHDVVLGASSSSFVLVGPQTRTPVTVAQAGLHMARNAAGALSLLAAIGVDPDRAADGLAAFRGTRRRFEHRGTVGGVTVIDDYAHHPTEIAANVRAAARQDPTRVWAVFQPHLYSRTELLASDFGMALSLADEVVVTDVFGARESPLPGVTGELVADAAVRAGAPSVHYVARRADVAPFVAERVQPGDVVLTMGAGDITLTPAELLALLESPVR